MLCMIAPACKSSDKSTSQVPLSNTGCENVKYKKHKYECYQSRRGCGAVEATTTFWSYLSMLYHPFPRHGCTFADFQYFCLEAT